MKPKEQEVWSDPFLDEIHKVREEMARDMKKDRRSFFKKLHQEAVKAGARFATLKPLPFPQKKPNNDE